MGLLGFTVLTPNTLLTLYTSSKATLTALYRFVFSNTDIAAAVNIGRIIARRCLQAGIERMVFHTETSTPTVSIVI